MISSDLCMCGCGQRTQPARQTRRGYLAGQPQRFVKGHFSRGPAHHMWKAGNELRGPYRTIIRTARTTREHVLVAERVLGKALPTHAVIHHIDGNGKNNDPSNLVVCQDTGYHNLLHQRQRALSACGNPNALKCRVCGHYDHPARLVVYARKSGRIGQQIPVHRECANERARDRKRSRAARRAS